MIHKLPQLFFCSWVAHVSRGIMELWRAKRYDAKVQRLSDGVNRYDDFLQREKERQRGATRREEAPAPSIEEAAAENEHLTLLPCKCG